MNVDEGEIMTALAVLGQAWGNLAAEIGPQLKTAITGGK